MTAKTVSPRRTLKRNDLIDLTRQIGGQYAIHGNQDLETDPLHRGNISFTPFGEGLSVHTVDVIDLEDFAAEASMPPSLSFSFVLNGSVTIRINDEEMRIGSETSKPKAEGGYLYLSQPGRFIRRARRDQRLRAAIVTATPSWFEGRDQGALKSSKVYEDLTKQQMRFGKWTLSSRQIMLAEQLMQHPQYEPFLHNLFLEGRAIEIIAEGLRALTGVEPNAVYSLRERDRERVEALKVFVETDEARDMSLGDMARRFGVNLKVLQRDFRVAHGTTIFNYLRDIRLEKSREALIEKGMTVAEAAYLAGYVSPANFATAFKKKFGMSPKQFRAD